MREHKLPINSLYCWKNCAFPLKPIWKACISVSHSNTNAQRWAQRASAFGNNGNAMRLSCGLCSPSRKSSRQKIQRPLIQLLATAESLSGVLTRTKQQTEENNHDAVPHPSPMEDDGSKLLFSLEHKFYLPQTLTETRSDTKHFQ